VVSRTLYRKIGEGYEFAESFESLKSRLAETEFGDIAQAKFYPGRHPSDALMRTLRGHAETDVRSPTERDELMAFHITGPQERPSFLRRIGGEAKPIPGPEEGKSVPRLYRVWFGTNREPLDRNDVSQGFGGERSMQLYYGFCDVSIPKWHTIGSTGDPWWKR